MFNHNPTAKLQHQLCELRLEERRVCSDIKHLVSQNKTIDFFQGGVCNKAALHHLSTVCQKGAFLILKG